MKRAHFVRLAFIAVPMACGDARAQDFAFGFRGCEEEVLLVPLGITEATVDLYVTLTTTNNPSEFGVQGWSFSLRVMGATIDPATFLPVAPGSEDVFGLDVEVSTIYDHDGKPSTPLVNPSYMRVNEASFKQIEPGYLNPLPDRLQSEKPVGVVSAIVLDEQKIRKLQPEGTVDIARLRLKVPVPPDSSDSQRTVILSIEDGLFGIGEAAKNVVTFESRSYSPVFSTCRLRAISRCDSVLVVDVNGGGDFREIQPAIDAANAGDCVLVKPGEYVIATPITLRGKAIAVRSEAGPEVTTIRMESPADPNRASVVIFEGGETRFSVLRGFTLTGGRGTFCGDYPNRTGGGILFVDSSPTVSGCRISRNTAQDGGGICCRQLDCSSGPGAYPRLINCVLSGNKANYASGIWVRCRASLDVFSCTLTGNRNDPYHYDVYSNDGAEIRLVNTIVWGNGTDPRQHNHVEGLHCLGGDTWTPNDTCIGCIEADPEFLEPGRWDDRGTPGDLDDDIWIEGDYHLGPTSPAIDAGAWQDVPSADLDGVARSNPDIGAYEFSTGGRQRPGDANQDGALDLSDAIWILGHLFLGAHGTEALPCEGGTASRPGSGDLALVDVNGDGAIDLSDPVSVLGFLFMGTRAPALGTGCVPIGGCPEKCR